jgi:putative radical SAM enzyme (TIGR03279 family)
LLEIADIAPGSAAEGLGIRKGESIVSVNGEEVHDVIDYQFLVADEHISITLLSREGRTRTVTLDKDPDDALGLEFAPLRITRCRNKCIFCFVDQMPTGCRKSLYVKDDDYRASFLYGNYITLGALSESGWQRIFKQRLSPLYVSVHSTDPALRSFIIGNKKAPDIMTNLRRLAEGGIRMHTQIVLCPGVNDGRFLDRTLDDLSGLFPAVSSIAVVPVGVTAFRKGLYPLRTFTTREARAVIHTITLFGAALKKRLGTRLLFASDEFYIKAGVPFPPVSFYEDFPQIENGVGMVADFLRDARRTRLPVRIAPLTATIVTGASFSPVLKGMLARLKCVRGLMVKLIAVPNRFFGPAVTVAGLLTGSDIAAALEGKRTGDLVIVPADALKEDEQVFLDGMRLDRLGELLKVEIFPARRFQDILTLVKTEGRRTAS